MAVESISLQHRLHEKVFFLVGVVFLSVTLVVLYFADTLTRAATEEHLALKHRAVEQAFNGYLARAEDEMRFIAQDLVLSDYAPGRELDLLFSHHEVLFSGGLDFFYIQWNDATSAMDPRARLFTQVDFQTLLPQGQINRWVSTLTEDGAILLMFKHKLLSKEQENLGFLYGFIALNDNLALVSELLGSAQISAVRIYDEASGHALLEESSTDIDLSMPTLTSRQPLVSAVQANLQLEIHQQEVLFSSILARTFPAIAALGFVLLCFYFGVKQLVRRRVFEPLEALVYRHQETLSPFSELQAIQQQNQQYEVAIKTKDQRFALLMASTDSAVIFSNEVAEVALLNDEAKRLFADAEKARTLFDFMPISCHQSIQEALKGQVGVTFELTMARLGRIYQWQAYSFRHEGAYRGVLLVGRNTTQETRLKWQLEQLQPLSSAMKRKVDTDAILNELRYLSYLPAPVTAKQLQGWIVLFMSVLDDIRRVERDVVYLPLGEVFWQESVRVIEAMGTETHCALLDCSVDVGARVVAVDGNLRGLVRTLLMMVMSNDMSERRLTARFNDTELELTAMNDMVSRPLFYRMISMLLTHLGGRQKTLRNHALQLSISMEESEAEQDVLTQGKSVAWVSNDYPDADEIMRMLLRLGLQVEEYRSADSFFMRSRGMATFDAILIGGDDDCQVQMDMTRALQLKYNRPQLPVVWINRIEPVTPFIRQVFTLSGCPFDYSLHKVLADTFALERMAPTQVNESGPAWVMVGGSRITKAIWYTELKKCELSAQWLTDLSSDSVVLSYHSDAIVVLLEPPPPLLLEAIQEAFPLVRFFAIQRWADMPDSVALFEMAQPYSSDQIRYFLQDVVQKTT
ncbi:hypothetical protein HGG82_06535 [Marinomonas sp. M1K-6]|uniref:Uncharacterized protein n=1 Tax=Marinomonas profundi TaxID=2726122 RepID=A0A847R0X3_9GAMM|nr:hypothetical protein [Marinomonas profundi]NLQ17281.1 hypothetical protein [Marinomonas profundi]UDV04530.1 hypothetical protein J8N69_07235 [Marinomonas profundi]